MATVKGNMVITGKARLMYPHLFEPYAHTKSEEPRYSACIVIPKTDTETIEAIKKAIDNTIRDNRTKFKGKITQMRENGPIRDGDIDKGGKGLFAGCYYINARSGYRHNVLDQDKNDITNEKDVYSGMYARACIQFYPYNTSGHVGIAASLGDVQKVDSGFKHKTMFD